MDRNTPHRNNTTSSKSVEPGAEINKKALTIVNRVRDKLSGEFPNKCFTLFITIYYLAIVISLSK